MKELPCGQEPKARQLALLSVAKHAQTNKGSALKMKA